MKCDREPRPCPLATQVFARRGCCDPCITLQTELESGLAEGPEDEAIEVHGRADHRDPAGAGSGGGDGGGCRRHGISSATFYTWKSKFGAMEVSDAKRLKVPEDEKLLHQDWVW